MPEIPADAPVLAKDAHDGPVPAFGPGSKGPNWDDPKQDPNKRKTLADVEAEANGKKAAVTFGVGSEPPKWDNPKNDPNKRKSVKDDPTGVLNAKLLG